MFEFSLQESTPLIIIGFIILVFVMVRKSKSRTNSHIPTEINKSNAGVLSKQNSEQLMTTQEQRVNESKYDKIINCPLCNGEGKVNIRITRLWRKEGYDEPEVYTVIYTKKLQDEYNNHIAHGMESIYNNDNKSTVYEDNSDCPYCKGDGKAYCWFDKIEAVTVNCTKCQGSGKVTTKIRQDIGLEEKQIQCNECNGTGKKRTSEKDIVHVLTKSGGIDSLKREVDEMDGVIGNSPKRFIVEITNDNRDFYAKHKAR